MPEKKQPQNIQQTASGNDNIQVAGSHNIVNRITNFFTGDPEQRAFRNRKNILHLVWNTWIEGVLKKSLYNEVLIELGMDALPDAVNYPWDSILEMQGQEPSPVAPGIKIQDLFDQTNGALLIVGEPGSGKTTILLELARQTIELAQNDLLQPIPIIFNLSSWTPQQDFCSWLVEELRLKYYIPEKLGHPLVENDELLLLLDGLDEVKDENREACVQTINNFRAEYNMPLAVCCRSQEYETLKVRLNLRGAVLIKPLTLQQVKEYLHSVNLTNVYYVMQHEIEFQQLVQTPLMLSIVVLTYQRRSIRELSNVHSLDLFHKNVFDAYITQMFRRKGGNQYHPEETKSWLAWLAQNISLRNQNVFLVEQLQPSWLSPSVWRVFYLSASRLIIVLVAILGIELLTETPFLAICGGISLITIWLSTALFQKIDNEIHVLQVFRWDWSRAAKGALIGIACGILIDVVYSQLSFESGGCRYCYNIGKRAGCLICSRSSILPEISFHLFFTSSLALVGAILGGVTSRTLENHADVNMGIRLTLRHAISFAFVISLVASLFTGLYVLSTSSAESTAQIPISTTLERMITGGLGSGLLAFLWFGGVNIIRHYTLRIILVLMRVTPRNYSQFLDHAVECIFLRRVGGGYIFVHRLLMEHFADMYHADEK